MDCEPSPQTDWRELQAAHDIDIMCVFDTVIVHLASICMINGKSYF